MTRRAIIPITIFRAHGEDIFWNIRRGGEQEQLKWQCSMQPTTRQSPERNLQCGFDGLRCRDVEEHVREEVR